MAFTFQADGKITRWEWTIHGFEEHMNRALVDLMGVALKRHDSVLGFPRSTFDFIEYCALVCLSAEHVLHSGRYGLSPGSLINFK